MVSLQGSWLCFIGRSAVLVLDYDRASVRALAALRGFRRRWASQSLGPRLLWARLAFIRSLLTVWVFQPC